MHQELIPLLVAYLERQDEEDRGRLNDWLRQQGQAPVNQCSGWHGVLDLLPRDLADELACDFTEHVLPLWEKHRPNDLRPRNAVTARRRWVRGEATLEEWRSAWSAAGQAVAECRVSTWTTNEEARSTFLGNGIAWTCCGGCLLTRGVDAAVIAASAACNAAGTVALQELAGDAGQEVLQRLADAHGREEDWQKQHLIRRLRLLESGG